METGPTVLFVKRNSGAAQQAVIGANKIKDKVNKKRKLKALPA
jgi:hypothetical protein